MPLDSSIISNQKDYQMDTMAETQAKRYALQQAQNQQDEYQYKLKKQQEADDEENTLNEGLKNSVEVGADGTSKLNEDKLQAYLDERHPPMGYKFRQERASRDAKNQESALDIKIKTNTANKTTLPDIGFAPNGTPYDKNNPTNINFDSNYKEAKPTQTRVIRMGNDQVTQEYNDGTKSWNEIGRGGAFAPKETTIPVGYQANPAGGLMPITGGPADKTTSLKQIPATVNKAMLDNKQSLAKLDQAIALLGGTDVTNGDINMKGDAEATGWKGYLPNGVLNRIDPKGVDARAAVTDVGSLLLHDRSGAAVTASETPRLLPFIPLATDDNATALKKLKRLKYEAGLENDLLYGQYNQDTGYKVGNDAPADNRGNQASNNGNIIPSNQKIPSNAYQSKAPPIQFPKARRAPDGFWYVKDASGQYQKVVQ